jgi:integrase
MLSQDVALYIDLHRSLGFKFRTQRILLQSFAAFAEEHGDKHIRSDRVIAWAAHAPSAPQRRNRLLTIRRFALAMHAEDPGHEIPAADALGCAAFSRRAPYIYTSGEIARLLRAAAELKPAGSIKPLTYATLLGLLAATGMRISEALALQLDDITADGLLIRNSKFHKSRLLPLHETARQALGAYLAVRGKTGTLERALFVSNAGTAPAYNTVKAVFLQLLRSAGLDCPPGRKRPRIHDLRHTFAVRSIEQCRCSRDAIARHIVALSTYLGHAHVTDTYWYLQATPLLMSQIAEAGEALNTGGAA